MEQVKTEPVAWIKPDWRDNFDGTSPVTVYRVAGWTPLYATPQPLSGPAVVGLVEAAKEALSALKMFCPDLPQHILELEQALTQIERNPEDGKN